MKVDQPLVSIIMNCYNGEEFLTNAIDSIYLQTYPNWEIIFWDNASTDNSATIAQSYNERLKYFRGDKTLPVYTARNLALKECKGLAIAFLDTDDIWLDYKLEKQVYFLKQDCPFIYGGYKDIDSDGNETGITESTNISGKITRSLLKRNPISIGCVMIKANLIKEIGFDPRYELLGDFDLWVRLSVDHEISYVDEILELSRQHGDNLSDTMKDNWLKERRYFYKKFIKSNSILKYPEILLYIFKTEIKGIFNVR